MTFLGRVTWHGAPIALPTSPRRGFEGQVGHFPSAHWMRIHVMSIGHAVFGLIRLVDKGSSMVVRR